MLKSIAYLERISNFLCMLHPIYSVFGAFSSAFSYPSWTRYVLPDLGDNAHEETLVTDDIFLAVRISFCLPRLCSQVLCEVIALFCKPGSKNSRVLWIIRATIRAWSTSRQVICRIEPKMCVRRTRNWWYSKSWKRIRVCSTVR
jgi:hypothetical protein